LLQRSAELNVDAAAGHVGRHGHFALFAGLGDYFAFAFVVFGVKISCGMPSRLR
jgi:hypothetical protein